MTGVRLALSADSKAIHESHMRSIREVCSKDHSPAEIKGWGNRPYKQEKWDQSFADPHCHIWAVEVDGQVRGFGYMKIQSSEQNETFAFIYGLYLAPEAIGLGLGKQTADLMLQTARDQGAKWVELDSSNTAHGFYLAQGFKDIGKPIMREISCSSVQCTPMRLDLT